MIYYTNILLTTVVTVPDFPFLVGFGLVSREKHSFGFGFLCAYYFYFFYFMSSYYTFLTFESFEFELNKIRKTRRSLTSEFDHVTT